MNYSDYDSDGYSSNEDADYLPSDDNLSEDDINECEREEPLRADEDVPHPDFASKKKKKKKVDLSVRKRKKGVLKGDAEEEEEEEEEGGAGAEATDEPAVVKPGDDDDAKQKKKSDDLWASFLSDVGSRPKEATPTSQPSDTKKDVSTVTKLPSPTTADTKPTEAAKVTITKVFDFAGEEVRVDKVVSADSREARSFLKSQNKQDEDEETSSSPTQATLPGPSAKRPGGMMNVLNRIGGKKPKMSTLEKSKMDWDAFKSEEGITEELAIHNRGRDGYVERKNFLERVDHRQFELEKSVRLSNMKQ